MKYNTAHNSRFVKAGVSCFYESLVQGSSSVFQMNICAKKNRLRKYEKRQWQSYDDKHDRKIMVKSKYISDILELLLDGDNKGISARQQLPFITEDYFDYTGGGLFIQFSHLDEIVNYKVSKENLILNGVKIQTTEFLIEADATLFFSNGIIDYLEIWCYQGDYPNQDLTKYTLTQIWNNSPNKIITTEN